jgi:hypothetical protein
VEQGMISTEKSIYSFERSELRVLQALSNEAATETMTGNEIFLNRIADMLGKHCRDMDAMRTRAALAEDIVRQYEAGDL